MKLSKEIKVGLFAFTGVVVFVVGFNFMMGFSFFKPYSRYHVVYSNTGGVVKSTQVLINGYKIGQVEEVSLLVPGDASKILVTMAVDGSIKLPQGTAAEISSSDLLGTKIIQLNLGNGTTILQENDTLQSSIEEGLAESISKMVSPIKEKSEQVLATLDRVLQSLNSVFDSSGTVKLSKGVDDLTGTLSHVRNITMRLDNLSKNQEGRLNDMFVHTESILRNLKNHNEVLGSAMKNIAIITDSLAASELKSTVNRLNQSLASLDVMLVKINKGEGTFGQLANNEELYHNLASSSKELTLLLADIQKYPGRYINVSVFGGSKRAEKADKKREADKKR